jgi:hypothetical protein
LIRGLEGAEDEGLEMRLHLVGHGRADVIVEVEVEVVVEVGRVL